MPSRRVTGLPALILVWGKRHGVGVASENGVKRWLVAQRGPPDLCVRPAGCLGGLGQAASDAVRDAVSSPDHSHPAQGTWPEDGVGQKGWWC